MADRSQRPLATTLAAPLHARNWRALANSFRRYRRPWRWLWRYVTGRGSYPAACTLRTRLGDVDVRLEAPDDLLTVNEVFCREDYPVEAGARVVVDAGANIGVSALWFLTEAPRCRCHLFEPNPALHERLRANLARFADRVVLHETALATTDGRALLGVEPTGRYGGIGVAASRSVEVPTRAAAAALEEIAAADGGIDLLKLDIEGLELEVLRSLPGDLLDRIEAIHLETAETANPLPGRYEMDRQRLVTRLHRRREPAPTAPAEHAGPR